ncbi:STT3 domain-containing protein [Desulfovibrio sp. JC022]|uniref:STT3 domain-containing protein n=1 Tax=Desulfovibrio sp. JC022 TaxID=2593642 RepID=UPI0013D4A45D|nr:STT3 domain-containing protein [Desulfovibrio sp. JC022]NDV22150.1 hypothetical protein [Desulfovibrio sp. JC022]
MNTRDESHKSGWAVDWKVFLLFAVLSFVFAFGLRAMNYPKWDNPAFMVDGEFIMGTHDAYCWLAGAKGVGKAATNPMSGLVKVIGAVTGAKYGNIGFWLPAVFAGFTGIAAFAWGMLVAGPWIGFCAGVYATSVPMFYFRTRLSYYDTDLVTLLFPLLISLLLARWLSWGMRRGWFSFEEQVAKFKPALWQYLIPLSAGALVSYGRLWHGDVFLFGLFALFASVFLALFCGSRENRPELLKGLVLFSAAALWGWIGIALALVLIAANQRLKAGDVPLLGNIYVYLSLIAALLIFSEAGMQLLFLGQKILSYLKPVADVATTEQAKIHYPGITQSVIEAQNIEWGVLLQNLTGNTYLSVFGLLGFLFVLYRRPCTLFLLPFAVMSLAAAKLGGRFSMFSGIVIGLGGAYLLYWILDRFLTYRKNNLLCRIVASGCMVIFLMVSIFPQYQKTAPSTIIYKEHAKALIAASEFAPEDSTFWTWWDWGYATMYFTGRKSFADGGRHGGPLLFPLAFAYTTPSYLQASQFMKYSAAHNGAPYLAWEKMNVDDVQKLIYSMGAKQLGYSSSPKQFIVASWSDVRLAYWLLYYGSFNLATGQGTHPNVSSIGEGFNLDRDNGRIIFHGGGVVPISGYDVAQKGRGEFRVFPDAVGPFVVINTVASQSYLVDEFTRNSLLLKLLLSNPSDPEVKNNFKLVYDGYPMVRIYEVI